MKYRNPAALGISCSAMVFLYFLIFAVIATAAFAPLEYALEYWLSYAQERPVDLPAWACWVAALVPPIAVIGGFAGGGLTLLVSYGIDNPHYVAN